MSRLALRSSTRTLPGRSRRRYRFLDDLEPRLLLSTTVVTANVADQQVASDGTLAWVGNTTLRVGDNGTNVSEVAGVFPFLLPTLPAGAAITSVSATFTLNSIGNYSSVVGTTDVYALGARTAATVLAVDFFEGAYNTDTTDATAIQQGFANNTTPLGALTTNSGASTNLVAYLNAQYAAGGAGKYAFLRLSSSAAQLTSRYWVYNTANNASGQPTLSITYDVTPAAPTGLTLTTTSSSTIDVAWTDNATNETAYIVERSTDGTNFTNAATLAANTIAWQDTGRSADTKYYYRVHATNNGTDSANTPVQSDTTLPTFLHTIWVDASYQGATKNGGFTTPYTTIASAMTASVAGDGIVVRNGVYREKVTMKAGTPGNPITLMSMPNERATVSGFQTVSNWTVYSGGIYTTTLTNWTAQPNSLYVNYTPQDLARSPDTGWWTAPTVTHGTDGNGYAYTVITDPTHLAGIPSLVGGYVQAHTASGNLYDGAPIVAHDTTAGTITTRSTSTTSASTNNLEALANNDYYMVKNTINLLNRPGEWAVVPAGTNTWTLYFWPNNVADLNATQSRFLSGNQITVSSTGHDNVIRGLEVTGNTGIGISVGGSNTTTVNVTVRDNLVHNNGGNGINLRYTNYDTVQNNLVLANGGTGISFSSVQHGTMTGNEVGYNTIDGVVVAGDVSGKLPTDPGFVPTFDVVVSNNYIHHHLGYSHSDGIQTYRTVSDLHILNNVILYNGQGIMTEETDNIEIGGNVIVNTAAYTVIGKTNSTNYNIHNNTIGGSGYGPYNLSTSPGMAMYENITIGQTGLGPNNSYYVGNRNFYHNPVSTTIIRANNVNYTSTAAFYAATGQDQNSSYGNPLFVNAPVVYTMMLGGPMAQTTTTLKVNSVTNFAVGDHIEINGDGVVRTITAIDTTNKKITFDVALPSVPMTEYVTVADWKTSTNYTLDLRLQAGSPAGTLSSTGGPVGATMSIQSYVAGDFNGDGVRDIPTASAAVIAGLPNPISWTPPSF